MTRYEITATEYLQFAEDSRRKRLAIIPSTMMNCYSIAAMAVFEHSMRQLAAGRGDFDALTNDMLRRQGALAQALGVDP